MNYSGIKPEMPFSNCDSRRSSLYVLTALCAFSALPLAAQSYGHGTSEVVIMSAKSIVAAIDSKEINREFLSDGTSVTEDRIACKVSQTGPYYLMVAGISRSADGFNTLREATGLYRDGDSLDDFATRLAGALPARLTPLLDLLRSANAAAFDQSFRNQEVLQLTLLGVEQGHPRAVIVTFRASQSGSRGTLISAARASCPGDCKDPDTVYALGMHEEVENFLYSTPEFTGTGTEHALQLIRLEYASHPDVVGGPASVVRVTGSGIVLEQPGACTGNADLPRLRVELDQAIAAISNVVVHEDVAQYSKHGREVRRGSVAASVRVVGGAEDYTWTNPNGNRGHLPEPWCGGELATMLLVTREMLSQGQGTISTDTLPTLEPVLVVTFHATAAQRHWQLVVSSRTYPVAFEGRAWFSPATGQLLRIRWETADLRLPSSAGITRIEWDETFAGSEISGHTVLTPSNAIYRVSYNRQIDRTDWTETRFSDFRRYGSTDTVQFEEASLR